MRDTESISSADLARELADERPPLLVDLARPAERAAGHVPGAYPWSDPDALASAYGRRRRVVVTSPGGRPWLVAWACRLLRERGFADVVAHAGGLAEWRAEGRPVAAGPTPAQPDPGPSVSGRPHGTLEPCPDPGTPALEEPR